jgi:hypothetical protein
MGSIRRILQAQHDALKRGVSGANKMPKTRNDIPQLGDVPIEAEYSAKMKFLERNIDRFFNGGLQGKDRKIGFCLMVYMTDQAERANYVSNAERAEIVVALKAQLARLEEGKL